MTDENVISSEDANTYGTLTCADGSQCGAVTAGLCANGASCINGAAVNTHALDFYKCKPITNSCNNGIPDANSLEVWSRLQYDNCSNQYILGAGISPITNYGFMNETYREHMYPWNESMCQPLTISTLLPSPMCEGSTTNGNNGVLYDYDAACYLNQAWSNILDTASGASYKLGGGVSQADQGTAPWANGSLGACGSYVQGCAGGLSDIPGMISSFTGLLNIGSLTGLLGGSGTTGGGTAINKPVGVPLISSQATNADLAKYPYERIFDPTHPFSPRWDWQQTDRDFSHRTLFVGSSNSNSNSSSSSSGGSGPCAGVDVNQLRPSCGQAVDFIGYDPIDSTKSDCVVRCAAVPVDILSFRANEFSACMGCRIEVNTACFWSEVLLLQVTVSVLPYYYYDGLSQQDAFNLVVSSTDGALKVLSLFRWSLYWGYMDPIGYCKDFYDTLGEWPVCSTKYDYPDDNVPYLCGVCNSSSGDDWGAGVKKCCDDLAHALAPINILKIRNLQKDPEMAPVPEGYAFREYFTGPAQDNGSGTSCPKSGSSSSGTNGGSSSSGSKGGASCPHMPYMRWWDTGTAAGGTGDSGAGVNYDADCDMGKDDVIVGVGIEGASCKYGGGGGSGSSGGGGSGGIAGWGRSYANGCIQVPKPDAMTSWSELKHYQMNSMHDFGLSCLVQYEKLYKHGGTEEGPLYAAGGYFNSKFYQPICDDKSQCGSGGTGLCRNGLACRQCISAGSGGSNGGGGGSGGNNVCPYDYSVKPWPLGWRGYLSDLRSPCRFPSLGGSSGGTGGSGSSGGVDCGSGSGGAYSGPGSVTGGLDNAQVGDIIFVTHPDTQTAGNSKVCADPTNPNCTNNVSVMPFMAIVSNVANSTGGRNTWKYDSCANPPCTGGYCNDGSTCQTSNGKGVTAAGAGVCTNGQSCVGYQNSPVTNMLDTSQCPTGAPCISTCSDHINVIDVNNGKFPDVCGNTDYRGQGQQRTIYKEFLPYNIYESLYPIGTTLTSSCGDSYTVKGNTCPTGNCGDGGNNSNGQALCSDRTTVCGVSLTVENDGNCIDPKMAICTFNDSTSNYNLWSDFEIYRPTAADAIRSGNAGGL